MGMMCWHNWPLIIIFCVFRYRLPHGRIDDQILLDFLGFDYNQDATSISERTGPADDITFPISNQTNIKTLVIMCVSIGYIEPTFEDVLDEFPFDAENAAELAIVEEFITDNEFAICRLVSL